MFSTILLCNSRILITISGFLVGFQFIVELLSRFITASDYVVAKYGLLVELFNYYVIQIYSDSRILILNNSHVD